MSSLGALLDAVVEEVGLDIVVEVEAVEGALLDTLVLWARLGSAVGLGKDGCRLACVWCTL